MKPWFNGSNNSFFRLVVGAVVLTGGVTAASAQGMIPGTGERLEGAGDDFEDANWAVVANWPKSSRNIDKRVREPRGYSSNYMWFESSKRGLPDIVERVPTPEGGLSGSKGALRIRSLYTGVPNRPSYKMNQDDLLFSHNNGSMPISWSPSVLVRVYMPPFEEWENRTGSTFGLRTSVRAMAWKKSKGLFFSRRRRQSEAFYPGIFVQFNSKTDGQNEKDSAVFIIRGNSNGQDFMGPEITQTGWWTLGISFTPDGRAHYYVSPGVDDLTVKDHVASHFPQGVHPKTFSTFFFNVVNGDDGKNWSTEWIIDDPAIYVNRNYRQARRSVNRR